VALRKRSIYQDMQRVFLPGLAFGLMVALDKLIGG
jgi:hypothetical protein